MRDRDRPACGPDRAGGRRPARPHPALRPDARRAPLPRCRPRHSRWATAADDLAAAAGGGAAGVAALVAEGRARFACGHLEPRFDDGCDVAPFLGCGIAAGSCVDINTYLVASLRAAGSEAAHLYGYCFPAQKVDRCVDGHCWVATRCAGETLDWDVAHHIKAELDPVRPALNPRGGRRVAVSDAVGWRLLLDGREIELKLLGEAVWLMLDVVIADPERTEIRAM